MASIYPALVTVSLGFEVRWERGGVPLPRDSSILRDRILAARSHGQAQRDAHDGSSEPRTTVEMRAGRPQDHQDDASAYRAQPVRRAHDSGLSGLCWRKGGVRYSSAS